MNENTSMTPEQQVEADLITARNTIQRVLDGREGDLMTAMEMVKRAHDNGAGQEPWHQPPRTLSLRCPHCGNADFVESTWREERWPITINENGWCEYDEFPESDEGENALTAGYKCLHCDEYLPDVDQVTLAIALVPGLADSGHSFQPRNIK